MKSFYIYSLGELALRVCLVILIGTGSDRAGVLALNGASGVSCVSVSVVCKRLIWLRFLDLWEVNDARFFAMRHLGRLIGAEQGWDWSESRFRVARNWKRRRKICA